MEAPTYLPLLNAIAVNEGKSEQLLGAWADTTSDERLKAALRFVAIREGEHAWAFTKRMCELGHAVNEDTAYQFFKDFNGLLACVRSGASDAEKIARLRENDNGRKRDAQGKQRDPFAGFFNDTTIDPATGALLGRYIAEERDSTRRLEAEYDRICGTGAGSRQEIESLKACIAELRAELDALKDGRC
ncbi:MAG: hypothetical protein R3E82_09680 [Pseudomonadales bacterium]|nr:hypothetical protein [Pseudomonadales bacterium]